MTDTTSIEPGTPVRCIADWLSLAAAPSFALMALVTYCLGRGAPDMLCGPMQGMSSLGGMVPMYLLMSTFHLTPWLKLVCGRRAERSRA
jgi:hypothetical protein